MTIAPARTASSARLLPARSLIVGVVILLGCLPLAAASAQPGGSLPSAEAWYQYLPGDGADGGGGGGGQPNPLCDAGLPLPGCPSDPTGGEDPTGGQVPARVNPYPPNTLHVSLNGGADDTVTFLELVDPLRPPGTVTGGTLILPVADDAGTASPETAEFQACAIVGTVTDGVEAGDPATAPEVDCSASSPAVYAAPPEPDPAAEPDPTAPAPTGTFTVDLAPLASRWSTADPAVALVPTDAAREAGATWHVAFDGRDRETESARPITVVLDVEPEEDDDGVTSGGSGGSSTGAGPPAGGGSSSGSGGSRPSAGSPAAGVGTAPSAPTSPASSGSAPQPPIGSAAAGDPLGTALDSSSAVDAPLVAAAPDGGALDAQVVSSVLVPSVGLIYPQAYSVPLLAVALGIVVATSLIKPMRLPEPPAA